MPIRSALGTTTQITSNTRDDKDPQISGNNIVWSGFDGFDWEIFHYNLDRRRHCDQCFGQQRLRRAAAHLGQSVGLAPIRRHQLGSHVPRAGHLRSALERLRQRVVRLVSAGLRLADRLAGFRRRGLRDHGGHARRARNHRHAFDPDQRRPERRERRSVLRQPDRREVCRPGQYDSGGSRHPQRRQHLGLRLRRRPRPVVSHPAWSTTAPGTSSRTTRTFPARTCFVWEPGSTPTSTADPTPRRPATTHGRPPTKTA